MEEFKKRRQRLKKSKNELVDKRERFQKYVDENESKRQRAIQKYKRELVLSENKKREFEAVKVLHKIEELRQVSLKKDIAANEAYRDFINETMDIMPAEFFLEGEKDIASIITRFNTLKDTHEYLLEHSVEIGYKVGPPSHSKLEREKCMLDEMRKSHENIKISILSRINALQNEYYVQKAVNDDFMQKFSRRNSLERDRQVLVSKIFMIINSLADNCAAFTEESAVPKLEGYAEKLSFIQKFILDKSYVCKLAQNSANMANADIKSRANKLANPKLNKTVS